MNFTEQLQLAGLARNEAKIYQALLQESPATAGRIAVKAGVHRRNVYDSIRRLLDRGLVREHFAKRERTFEAVNPDRLAELANERITLAEAIVPALEKIYRRGSYRQEVYIYGGPEGWKNYMRDLVRIEEDSYFIAAKGGWLDDRVKHFFPRFIQEAERKKMRFYHLFDHEVKQQFPKIIPHIGKDYRFLPQGFSTGGAVDIFGDHVNLIPELQLGRLGEEMRLVVLVSEEVANAFRAWFKLMWSFCD